MHRGRALLRTRRESSTRSERRRLEYKSFCSVPLSMSRSALSMHPQLFLELVRRAKNPSVLAQSRSLQGCYGSSTYSSPKEGLCHNCTNLWVTGEALCREDCAQCKPCVHSERGAIPGCHQTIQSGTNPCSFHFGLLSAIERSAYAHCHYCQHSVPHCTHVHLRACLPVNDIVISAIFELS